MRQGLRIVLVFAIIFTLYGRCSDTK